MLKNLKIKPFYNSSTDNIITDFYNPVLSSCRLYKRVSAYFDSNILSLYSKGVENIVNNNGHIFFIFSNELSEKDFNLIKNGYKERERFFSDITDKIFLDESSIELRNLGYLIMKGYVDIKIAFTRSNGIFHDKFGLFEMDNDIIYFRGSNNETVASIKSNFESFETTCSWLASDSELSKIHNALSVFDSLWNNSFSEDVLVFDIPEILRNKLINYSNGKLIYTASNYINSIVIDYTDRVIITNHLENHYLLSPENSFYKRSLELYVETMNDFEYRLKNSLNYTIIKRMISEISEFSIKKGFNLYLTSNIQKYIEDKDILIEKRRSLGISIKEKMSVLNNDFMNFCNIVNSNMIRELRKPQLWDAYHIVRMLRSANFSVPGAGKTAIVYGAYAYLQHTGEINKLIMIGPINSFNSWIDEFRLCFGFKQELKVFDYQKEKTYNSQDRFNKIAFDASKMNLILFNYESLQANVDALTSLIDSKSLLVFDEVHRIKSVTGIRAGSAKRIGVNAKYRVVLTGTPIPNGYIDLFNMLNILFTDEYETFFRFDENYLIGARDDKDKQLAINNSIYPFFCRTNKEDLNVPKADPDNIIDGYCITTKDEEQLFESIYRGFRHNTLTLYIRLIQASNNPRLILSKLGNDDISLFNTQDYSDDFSKNAISNNNYLTESDKKLISSFDMTSKYFKGIDLVVNLVTNGKVLVWAIFIDTIKRIEKDLLCKNIKVSVITGSTPISERDEILDHFIKGDLDVLITNPHTLGESVSLHRTCHQAVYFEYSFNLVHMLQSRDRIHRLGLPDYQNTSYYYMILDTPNSIYSPIDSKIYNRLQEKERLQSEALSSKLINYVSEDLFNDIRVLFGDLS